MNRPTPTEVRSRSPYLTEQYPAPSSGADALDPLIAEAAALVSEMTCRNIGHGSGDEVPTGLVPLAQRAVVLKTEQIAQGSLARATRARLSRRTLRSFNAGSYGESYFDPGAAAKARQLDPDPAVHETLWTLATEACRDRWLAVWSGEQEPASLVVSPSWAPRDY